MGTSVDVPVLVVGGGIVGLSASLFLSHHGIRSLLVERHAGTSIYPRARGFNARTMEMFRELGVEEQVREVGAELNPSKGMFRGTSLVEVIEPKKRSTTETQGDSPLEGVVKLFSPAPGARATQDFTEPVLLKAARAQPTADIRFHTECTKFEQSGSGVTAALLDRNSGETSTVHAQYLIGADGAGSPVRQRLGVGTTGQGRLGSLLTILFEADLRELVRGREFSLCMIERPEVRGLFSSINNSDRWAFFLSYDQDKGERAADFPHERCQELVKVALGMPQADVKIITTLPWDPSVRVATTLQKGRAFLAGDAAHQMPPWRGQGATSGVADVHNLTWKLAAVLKGQATPALLDTYNRERLPVGRAAAEMSGKAANEHGLISINVMTMLRTIPTIPRIGGFGYSYLSAAIGTDDGAPYFRIPWYPIAWALDMQGRPGTRVPHLWVQQGGQQISTLDVCGRGFTLLVGTDKKKDWSEAASTVSKALDLSVSVYSIGPAGDLVDSKNQWLYLAGIAASGALLVRPDGFVAWRTHYQPANPAQQLDQTLRQILHR